MYTQGEIRLGEWEAQTSLGFLDTNGSPILGETITPSDSQQKNRTFWIRDSVDPTVLRVKMKEREKKSNWTLLEN